MMFTATNRRQACIAELRKCLRELKENVVPDAWPMVRFELILLAKLIRDNKPIQAVNREIMGLWHKISICMRTIILSAFESVGMTKQAFDCIVGMISHTFRAIETVQEKTTTKASRVVYTTSKPNAARVVYNTPQLVVTEEPKAARVVYNTPQLVVAEEPKAALVVDTPAPGLQLVWPSPPVERIAFKTAFEWGPFHGQFVGAYIGGLSTGV